MEILIWIVIKLSFFDPGVKIECVYILLVALERLKFISRFTNHYTLSHGQNKWGSYGKVWDQDKWAVAKIRCSSFIHKGQKRINISLSFARLKIFDQNLFLQNDCSKSYICYWVGIISVLETKYWSLSLWQIRLKLDCSYQNSRFANDMKINNKF